MDKVTAKTEWEFFPAPYQEFEEILLAVLSSNGYLNYHYNETPRVLHCTRQDRSQVLGRSFSKEYRLEVRWKKEPDPPPEFAELKAQEPAFDSLRIKLLFQDPDDNTENATAILEALFQEIWEHVQETVHAMKTWEPPTDHGTARWATIEDLSKEDYLEDVTHENPDTRFKLGTLTQRLVSVPTRQTEAHAVIQGPPGSGKSRTLIIPNLVERPGTSAIVTEVVSAEHRVPVVYEHTAGYRKSLGHQVYYINPSDLKNSTRFNPIDFITGVEDAIYYADLIITNTTMSNHFGDQIWTQSEKHLLTALLLYVWGLGGKKKTTEGGNANIGYIRALLRHGPQRLNEIIAGDGIPEAVHAFDEFIRNSSPNFRLGVFSGLIQRLNPWLNPKVAALTAVTDFDRETLKENLFTIYLAYPVNRRDFKPIMSLALNFFMQLPCRRDFVYDKPLTFLLDELAAFGRVPGIDDLQATIRNNKIGMVLCFQDLEQITKIYSQAEADVLFTNSATKIIFSTGSPKAQRRISEMLGYTTKIKKTVSSSGHVNKTTFGAPLMAPADVGRIPDKHILVIRDKRSPVMVQTGDPGKYDHLAKQYPPPEGKEKPISESIYHTISEAQHLEFSQTEAQRQAEIYESKRQAMLNAEAHLQNARNTLTNSKELQKLRAAYELARSNFEEFAAQVNTSSRLDHEIDDEEEEYEEEYSPPTPPASITHKTTPAQLPESSHLANKQKMLAELLNSKKQTTPSTTTSLDIDGSEADGKNDTNQK
jgi:type IV secretory pathway TraG/TraD family ATPase VirD4